jgi:hypothetical protein
VVLSAVSILLSYAVRGVRKDFNAVLSKLDQLVDPIRGVPTSAEAKPFLLECCPRWLVEQLRHRSGQDELEILIGVEVFPQLNFRDVPTSLPEDSAQSTRINLALGDDGQRLFFTLR